MNKTPSAYKRLFLGLKFYYGQILPTGWFVRLIPSTDGHNVRAEILTSNGKWLVSVEHLRIHYEKLGAPSPIFPLHFKYSIHDESKKMFNDMDESLLNLKFGAQHYEDDLRKVFYFKCCLESFYCFSAFNKHRSSCENLK